MILSAVTFSFDSYLSELVENKTKHRKLHSYWPLNRGKSNRKTLIGTAKRWPGPLCRVGRLRGVFLYSILLTVVSGLQ